MSLPYFPMFPTDFDADTGHLTFAEDGAYNRLLRLSWKCPGAKMPDDLEWIYRRSRAISDEDKALVRSIIGEFFARVGGKVFSRRLVTEWEKSSLAHAKRIAAGSAGGNAKAARTKGKEPSNATAMLYQPEPEPYREDSVAKATDASVDFAKQLFDRGVAFLGRHGTPDRQARSVIGRWRKAYQDTDIFEAFAACSKEGIVDPVPWITAKLSGKGKTDGNSHSRGERFLRSFVAGASVAPRVDTGPNCDTSRPLLARG